MSVNIGVNLCQEVSPSKMSSLSPKSWKNASHTSWKEFCKRVASFLVGEASLELKPVVFSPAACARYGWKSVGKCILQCVACNAVLCGKLPFPWNSDAYDECVKELVKSLKSSHKKNCPWLLAPSPEHFVRMHPMDRNEASSDLIDRVESLLTLEELPVIETDVLKKLKITEQQIESLCQSSHLPLDRYSKSAIVLALTGWSRSPSTERKKYLWCCNCQRIVALWFYTLANSSRGTNTDEKYSTSSSAASVLTNTSISNKTLTTAAPSPNNHNVNSEKDTNGMEAIDPSVENEVKLELVKENTSDVDCEKREKFQSPARKRYKINSQDELDLFDPLYEHRNWCMWICEGGISKENDIEGNPWSYGWQIFLKSILRGVESPVTTPECVRHVSKEKVKKVRQMLENWS